MCDILEYFEKKGVILPKREKSLGKSSSLLESLEIEEEKETDLTHKKTVQKIEKAI